MTSKNAKQVFNNCPNVKTVILGTFLWLSRLYVTEISKDFNQHTSPVLMLSINPHIYDFELWTPERGKTKINVLVEPLYAIVEIQFFA